ncbi:HAD family phosphatase [Candidatus Roizmanbacteria bacterium]|nr:HAD family phosphatase [Candidatus Roizmanbacteria bacterium]
MLQAVIFDFDGVIVLSEQPRFQVIQKSAKIHGVIIEDQAIKQLLGRNTRNFLTDVLSPTQMSVREAIIADYEKEYKGNITKYVQPIGASIEFIKNYQGQIPFALASMSSRLVVERLLQHFDISTKFVSIICKEDVMNHKPDPEIYLKSAQRLSIAPSNCIVIEDTVVGIQAALNAGMQCFVLINGFNHQEEFTGIPVSGFIQTEKDFENLIKFAV